MKKIVLSAAFALVGTFAMAQHSGKVHHKDPAQMEQRRDEKLKMMQNDLNLTDAQVEKIKALHEKRMAERKAMEPQLQAERQAKHDAWKAKNEQHKAELKQILTAEQYKKWEAKRDDEKERKDKRINDMQMKKMPAK